MLFAMRTRPPRQDLPWPGRALNQALLPEVIVGLGQIPLVQYATPGTPELSAALEPFVPHYDALLLANHGAVTCVRIC